MKDIPSAHGIQTTAVHAAEPPDPVTYASSPNLVMSTTFVADADATFSVEGLADDSPYFYTRWGNPTIDQLERKLRALEQAEGCIAFASGMAAVTAVFLSSLEAGDHVVLSDVTYAATAELAGDLLTGFGIKVTKVDASDLTAVEAAMTDRTKLVYIETPCNPLLRLTDIQAIAGIAHRVNAKLAVDSTFATPVATRPIALGADYVVHSLTKYIGGHGDALGGAVLGSAGDLAQMRKRVAIRTGGVISPFNAWLILRGIATLPIRMKMHEQNALQVARFLEEHPKVTRVVYPGLPSHPQFDLARRQMACFSGMLTFQTAAGPGAARILAGKLRVIHNAVSLGHHRSLIFYLPTDDMLANSFHLEGAQAQAYRRYAGDGIFRLSVGIEDAEDLIADLEQALAGLP
ncbi:MAG: aminotransferase class I/II-fold pyridoxal phosphate-dependent enzyme [Capsulimonadaceae bacterium]|nr:aminotransferase class I/II-fold pyridoxal phosphate-dependent enzyme [Capsulimonadaceae bacterium]